MQRAGQLLSQMPLSRRCATPEQLAASAWPSAVGKRLAGCTGPVHLVRSRLVVEVEDAVWQKQLWSIRNQILANLQKIVGAEMVSELEFRIRLPRIEPQREERATAPQFALTGDEADGIADPYLRKLYVAARRRALA